MTPFAEGIRVTVNAEKHFWKHYLKIVPEPVNHSDSDVGCITTKVMADIR